MTLPYLGRFACLALSAFFLTHTISSLLVWLVAARALGASVCYDPRSAARILFWLRVAPMALAFVVVAAVLTPSYLLFEPTTGTEELSAPCLLASLLGVAILALGSFRGAAAMVRSARYLRAREENEVPVILVAGLFHPRLVISSSIRRLLTEEEYAAALRHEEAHRRAKDNLKRLLILMSPKFFPFCRRFQMIEASWQRLAEWAADDSAAGGSKVNALALASALIRVGRMNAGSAGPIPLGTSLLADTADLRTRVERLVEARQPYRPLPGKSLWTAIGAAVGILIAFSPDLLRAAHVFSEALAR